LNYRIVELTGLSGSGKTTFCDKLNERLHSTEQKNSIIIDFYNLSVIKAFYKHFAFIRLYIKGLLPNNIRLFVLIMLLICSIKRKTLVTVRLGFKLFQYFLISKYYESDIGYSDNGVFQFILSIIYDASYYNKRFLNLLIKQLVKSRNNQIAYVFMKIDYEESYKRMKSRENKKTKSIDRMNNLSGSEALKIYRKQEYLIEYFLQLLKNMQVSYFEVDINNHESVDTAIDRILRC